MDYIDKIIELKKQNKGDKTYCNAINDALKAIKEDYEETKFQIDMNDHWTDTDRNSYDYCVKVIAKINEAINND